MAKAPCNLICESGCSSGKGCAINLLEPCSEFCVDPPPEGAGDGPSSFRADSLETFEGFTPAQAFVHFVTKGKGKHLDEARALIAKALKAHHAKRAKKGKGK